MLTGNGKKPQEMDVGESKMEPRRRGKGLGQMGKENGRERGHERERGAYLLFFGFLTAGEYGALDVPEQSARWSVLTSASRFSIRGVVRDMSARSFQGSRTRSRS